MLVDIYSGDHWEEFCGQLLKLKHGDSNVFKVPATLAGDGGLDFHTPSGIVYQCYAPEDEYEADKLYVSIRGKITTDINKFTSNTEFHKNLFQNKKVERWVLLTPKIKSKDVNVHCSNKTSEVRQLQLGYVENNAFEVTAYDGEFYFDLELAEYVQRYASSLKIEVDLISVEDILKFRQDNNKIIITVDGKLNGKVNSDRQLKIVDRFVEKLLVFNQIMASLRKVDTNLHDKIDRFFKEKDSQIEDLVDKGVIVNFQDVQNEKNQLRHLFTQIFSSKFDPDVIEKIIEGKEASWIIDCPLRFE